MRRIALRVVLGLGLGIVVFTAALAAYVGLNWDRSYESVPLPDLHASNEPAVVARGEYLVRGPAHCVECHSSEERQAVEGAQLPLSGGRVFPIGPLGTLYTRNLTPDDETGIGRYSDPQLARMVRHGVRPDGQASIPLLMPYGDMSDEDVIAVLSYLRAQPPVRNAVPENQWTMLGKVMRTFVAATKPRLDVQPQVSAPASEATVARGAYLARSVANCGGCHTAYNPLTGASTVPTYSGGGTMESAARTGADAALLFTPPNLTPRQGSALMKFPDRETFVARFTAGGRHYPGSPMPWEAFGRMTPDDVGALYEFLRAQAPAGDASPWDPRTTSTGEAVTTSIDEEDLAAASRP